jgi:carbonic anhydrase
MRSVGIEESRIRLLRGVRKFQSEVYPRREAAYRQVAREGQRPHALFITCADSRIDPELITQSGPGEIFVCRNVGNLVSPYGDALDGVSAIIEYAVSGLEVAQVVVCGHSDCGAMIGLLHPERVAGLPTVRSWLHIGEAALSIVRNRGSAENDGAALQELIEANVLLQLLHLRTHPSVAGRLAQGSLAIAGWVYDIGHGSVSIYDEQRACFVGVSEVERPASGGSFG